MMIRPSCRLRAAAFAIGVCVLPLAGQADTLRIGGAGAALGTLRLLAAEFEKASPGDTLVVVPNLGTSGGLKALNAGALDLGAVARPLRSEEAAAGLVAVEYGRTPFVLATSRTGAGPVRSMAEVEALYTGRRATWPSGTPVRLVLRPLQDGDTQALGDMSAELKAALPGLVAKPGMIVAATDQDTAEAIERTPGAIGTLTLALITTEKRQVQIVPLNGVVPSVKALVDGTYPYAKTLRVVRRNAASPAVARFMDFLASPRARQVIAEAGHAPPSGAKDPR